MFIPEKYEITSDTGADLGFFRGRGGFVLGRTN